jgi:hypothetical protein
MAPRPEKSRGQDGMLNFGLDLGENGLPLLATKKTKWNKVVTVLNHVSGDVQGLANTLQHALGTGGRVRGSAIELMGDQREAVLTWLLRTGRVQRQREEGDEGAAPEEAHKERAKARWSAEKRAAAAADPTAAETETSGADDDPWSEFANLEGAMPEEGVTEGYKSFLVLVRST